VIFAIGVIGAMAAASGVVFLLRRSIWGRSEQAVELTRGSGGSGRVLPLNAVAPAAQVVATTAPSRPGRRSLPPIRRASSGGRSNSALLPPDAVVSLAAERRAAAIDEVFAALERELVGLVPVKRRVQEIGSLLLVDRVRQRFGLSAPRPNLHMCFTGAPGTGKTTVGLLMSDLLHRLGYLQQGHLVHAMRNDLVGEYVGQTAPKTKRVLDKAMGGVLFIDEASALYQPDNSKDFGQEAIEILLQVMENQRDELIVIFAGYKDRMEEFFSSNPGLRSRVAHHLDFADYDLDELTAIGKLMLERACYYLSPPAETAFRACVTTSMTRPHFANARTVRNELERARLRHAHRLAAQPDRHWNRDDLMRLEPEDILPGYGALSESVVLGDDHGIDADPAAQRRGRLIPEDPGGAAESIKGLPEATQ
jgi:probable Rubsico expression protein CbbX